MAASKFEVCSCILPADVHWTSNAYIYHEVANLQFYVNDGEQNGEFIMLHGGYRGHKDGNCGNEKHHVTASPRNILHHQVSSEPPGTLVSQACLNIDLICNGFWYSLAERFLEFVVTTTSMTLGRCLNLMTGWRWSSTCWSLNSRPQQPKCCSVHQSIYMRV